MIWLLEEFYGRPCLVVPLGGELVIVRNDYITKERGALGDCYPTPSATTYENLLNRRKFQGGGGSEYRTRRLGESSGRNSTTVTVGAYNEVDSYRRDRIVLNDIGDSE